MFVDGPMMKTSHGWVPYRDVRAYRDGRLIATYYQRVLPARDRVSASLLYDEKARTARSIRGGPARPFDPCPGTFGVGNYVELSPSGRWGLFRGEGTAALHGETLVLFDPRSPRTTRRVIFTSPMNGYHPAAWLDERRIAVAEYRDRACPPVGKGYDWATSVAIIDRQGSVHERGPCVFGVVAGPHGLVLEQFFPNAHGAIDVIRRALLGRRDVAAQFSTDGGRTWNAGRPQFADADGNVFYQDNRWDDYTLYEDGKPTGFHDVHGAMWARP